MQQLLTLSAAGVNDGDNEDDNVASTGLDFPRVNAYEAVKLTRQFVEAQSPPQPSRHSQHATSSTWQPNAVEQ